MEKNKILVPVDFLQQSLYALEYAVKIAKSIQAKISCLYVIEEPGYITSFHLSKEVQDKIRRDAEVKLAEAANRVLKLENISFEIIVAKGKVYRKIIETSNRLNAQFIIMGKSGSSDSNNSRTGTNTNHVIGISNIPVITIRNNKHVSDNHFLLPLDLTKPVRTKMEKAIEIADQLNARITVLTVFQKDWIEVKSKFQKKLNEIQTIIENQNLACNTELIETSQPIDTVINKYATKIGAGLIFLMTHQESESTEYFIGSTAKEVICKSELPLLSVIPCIERNEQPDFVMKGLSHPISPYSKNYT